MSGPLSRCRFSSDLLLEEDDEAIQWTYVSTQNDSSHGDVPTYTSEGVGNKRRKLYRQKKDELDIKPTSSSTCTESVEWTEEEELSLCQAVSICLQQTSSESLALKTEALSDLERNPTSVLSRNISKELQTLEISKYLAECLVPSHEHRDVLARVRSSAFRRAFMGFLDSKSRRTQSLLCMDSAESNSACISSGGDAPLKDEKQQDLKSSPFSKPELHSETFESGHQQKDSSLIPTKQNGRKTHERTEKVNSNPKSKRNVEPPHTPETDVLLEELVSLENETDKFQQTRRSSSRLRKQQPKDLDTSRDNEDLPDSTRQTPQDSTDHNNSQNLAKKTLNFIPESQPHAKTDKQKKRLPRIEKEASQREQGNTITTETSSGPAKTDTIENQGQDKSHQKVSSRLETAELQQPPSSVRVKKDTKCKSEKPTKLTAENKVQTFARHLKESTSSEQEDTKAISDPLQLTPSDKAPLLATVRPLRKAQNEEDNQKRSYKKFRKKFLDRCLEVQHSGLGLTARVPYHRTNTTSNVHSSLEEFLTTQHVQQSRKGILDACLMAQRDSS